jgi:chemotaxis protein MotB
MYKKILSLIVITLLSFFIFGCVTDEVYQKKVSEFDSQASELAALQQKYKDLTNENNSLKDKIKTLTVDRDQLKEGFTNATKDKEDLEKILEGKSDSLKQSIVELKKKNADLEAENTALKEKVTTLEKTKEEVVQSAKKEQDQLLQEMKGEIAKGQITITELKGKLTVNMVDKILFNSGESEVKEEGLEILKRVVDILKNAKDKTIRIEGHTDNVAIRGNLAKKYPTNWELSAARAINVTKFLQKEGIDPQILSAQAFGEYKPIADNSDSEGKAKNRRIAIILLPKE